MGPRFTLQRCFESAMHGSKVYSADVGLKGLALSKFSVIKYIYIKREREREE